HCFTLMPADPARVDITSVSASDEALRSRIGVLAQEIDPSSGVMLRALAVRGERGSGAIVLVAHHLVVDIWSWSVIEDRLRLILGARHGSSRLLPPDH